MSWRSGSPSWTVDTVLFYQTGICDSKLRPDGNVYTLWTAHISRMHFSLTHKDICATDVKCEHTGKVMSYLPTGPRDANMYRTSQALLQLPIQAILDTNELPVTGPQRAHRQK